MIDREILYKHRNINVSHKFTGTNVSFIRSVNVLRKNIK